MPKQYYNEGLSCKIPKQNKKFSISAWHNEKSNIVVFKRKLLNQLHCNKKLKYYIPKSFKVKYTF